MASSNNNTTSLSMGGNGTIGTRDFKDNTSREISAGISRRNYEKAVVSDERMQELREAVYKMVSSWIKEDKLYMLREYGDIRALGKNPSEKDINKLLTESIIIHLSPGDLQQLYNDVMVTGRKMKKDVKDIEKKRKGANKKVSSLNISNFNDISEKIGKNKNYEKARKEYVPGLHVPRNITNKYGALRRELLNVLRNCYNPIELTGIALSMGIDIPDGNPKFKDIANLIINKTLLYVDLINGHGKGMYSNAFMDSQPYDDLLGMTSYSWVTGKPGMTKGEWVAKQEAARRAKIEARERARLNSRRKRFNTRGFSNVAGGKSGSLRSVSRSIEKNDTGILADATYDQLIELAGKYGIEIGAFRNKRIGVLKAKIYAGMANEDRRINRLTRREERQSRNRHTSGAALRNTREALMANKKYSYKTILESTNTADGGVPIVEFNGSGKLITASILKAVPVYIVGEGRAGTSGTDINIKIRSVNKPTDGLKSSSSGKTKHKDGMRALSSDAMGIIYFVESLSPYSRNKKRGKITSLNDLMQMLHCTYHVNWAGSYGVVDGVNIIPNQKLEPEERSNNAEQNIYMIGDLLDANPTAARIYLLYAYGIAKKDSKLQQAVIEKYGSLFDVSSIHIDVHRIRGALASPFKGIGRMALNILKVSFAPIVGIAKGIISIFSKHGKIRFPQSPTDLNEKDRAKYENIRGLREQFIISKLKEKNVDISPLDEIDNTEHRITILKAAYANVVEHSVSVANLFLFQGGLLSNNGKPISSDHAIYLQLTKGKFRKIGNFFRQRIKFFKKSGSAVDTSDARQADEDANNLGKDKKHYSVPTIYWSGSNTISGEFDVVPVYVVNDKRDWEQWGSDGKNRGKAGRKNRQLAADAYNQKFGADLMSKNLKFTVTDPQAVLDAEKAVGRKPKKKQPQVDKKYSATKAMISWALENNKKFAVGGESFIAGDSLNNKPNPERVTIKGDGSFSVQPLKQGPQNGYSDYALNKYATGKDVSSEIVDTPEGFTKEAKRKNRVKSLRREAATPVYIVNNNHLNELDSIKRVISSASSERSSDMAKLMLGLGTFVSAAPMGVGAITNPTLLALGTAKLVSNTAADAIDVAMDTVSDALGASTFATGGTVKSTGKIRHVSRFATGGTAAITGDAAGSNMFANGAKPELVQSSGDMKITPLNSMSSASQQKTTRMTSTERSQALATGITSHIVKFKFEYTPNDLEEVSNTGEAIKVYNVKPGITDSIDINGTQMSLMDMLSAIYVQLGSITENGTTGNQLLATIAAKPTGSNASSSGSGNPFAGGFPSSLDSITGGN